MTVKKRYAVGDTVWVYGISRSHQKLTQGKVIKIFDLSDCGYDKEPHYMIQIPSPIEPLLEIRTWHTISQDNKGPVGSYRELIEESHADATAKKLQQGGLNLQHESNVNLDEPTTEQINAALDKSQQDLKLPPLVIKEPKPKVRRPTTRKKRTAVV
jgi:hypothetical protein